MTAVTAARKAETCCVVTVARRRFTFSASELLSAETLCTVC